MSWLVDRVNGEVVIIDNDADGLIDDDENNNYLTNLIIQTRQ